MTARFLFAAFDFSPPDTSAVPANLYGIGSSKKMATRPTPLSPNRRGYSEAMIGYGIPAAV